MVELLYMEIPVVITGNGFTVNIKLILSSQLCIHSLMTLDKSWYFLSFILFAEPASLLQYGRALHCVKLWYVVDEGCYICAEIFMHSIYYDQSFKLFFFCIVLV